MGYQKILKVAALAVLFTLAACAGREPPTLTAPSGVENGDSNIFDYLPKGVIQELPRILRILSENPENIPPRTPPHGRPYFYKNIP